MILRLLELGFVGATTLSLSFLISTWVYRSPRSLGRFIHIGYFTQSWLYLAAFHLRSFAPVPSPDYLFRVVDLVVLTFSAWNLWTLRDQLKSRLRGAFKVDIDGIRSIKTAGNLPIIAALSITFLIAVVSLYNLRHQYFNTDDVLTLYLPRIDFMLSEGSPLSLSTSTYDSLLNSYPYGPQIMPYRLAMIIDSRLALLLDSTAIVVIGALAINQLAIALGCSKVLRSGAILLWTSSPMVLSQMGAGLTDLHFSAAILAALAVVGPGTCSPHPMAPSPSRQYVVFFVLVCLVFSYKLLALFYVPILGVGLLMKVLRGGRIAVSRFFMAFLSLPIVLFPVWNSIRMNWDRYGHPLGDPGVFGFFSESASFSDRIAALRVNLGQVMPDLLGGNAVASGGPLHDFLDVFAVWGVGVRAAEGVVGPGFAVTLVAFLSAGIVGALALSNLIVLLGRKAGPLRTVLAKVSVREGQNTFFLAALALSSTVTFLGIIYQRQVYSIATVRYLLAVLLVVAVVGLATLTKSSGKRVRQLVAVAVSLFIVVQVAVNAPLFDQLKRGPFSSSGELSDARGALAATSGFIALGDQVSLLDAFMVCIDKKSEVAVINTARDKFPHGFYSGEGASYTLSPSSEVRDWSIYEVALGDQLGQQPESEDRHVETFGFQWLSVDREYWRC